MIKNTSGQKIGAEVVSATTGAAFASTVTVYVTGDAGTQAIGSVGSGLCTLEGNGYYSYAPAQAETNYDLIAFTFIGAGAVPATVQVFTISATTYAQLATVSATATTRSALATITGSLKLIGVLDPTETATAPDAADGLAVLQELIQQWGTERLTITTVARTTFPLVVGTQTYTIGTGATINVVRPLWIDEAKVILGTGETATEVPLDVLTDQQWQGIVNRSLTGAQPRYLYDDFAFSTSGYSTVSVWPVPSAVLTVALYLPTPIVGPTALTTVLSYPPGYAKALRYNLALDLCPYFGVDPPALVVEGARTSKALIKRANSRPVELAMDRALTSPPTYSIYSDGWS